MTIFILLFIFAYLLGSINSAILVCKAMNLPSPRDIGSGNPGATNVLRSGSKTAALLTILGDGLKGIIPVVLAQILHLPITLICWIGLAAVIGHIFPLFFKFKGGKGVATSLGVILSLNPILGLSALATWLVVAFALRISSLAALAACLLTPVFSYLIMGSTTLVPMTALAIIVMLRHHQNIKRIINGIENKMGEKNKPQSKKGV